MNMKKRVPHILLAAIIVLSLVACSTAATNPAANYPKKPMEIIVGYSAGGANHLAAENLKPEAQEVFGQPMTVTCKPGAASAVANSYVLAAAADGYTILNGSLSLPITLSTGADYKMEDFVGVAMFSDITPCIAVRTDSPFNTIEDLKEYVNANPGTISWGHPGVGAALHVAGSLAFDSLGILDKLREVPFNGTNESVAQLLGGHIDMVMSFPSTIQEQVRGGNAKILAVTGSERVEEFPDAPTMVESGYDAVLTNWRGIFVRSDTPQEIIDVLEAGFAKIIQSDTFRERAEALGEPAVYMNAKEFTALYHEQCETVRAVADRIGLSNKK